MRPNCTNLAGWLFGVDGRPCEPKFLIKSNFKAFAVIAS